MSVLKDIRAKARQRTAQTPLAPGEVRTVRCCGNCWRHKYGLRADGAERHLCLVDPKARQGPAEEVDSLLVNVDFGCPDYVFPPPEERRLR